MATIQQNQNRKPTQFQQFEHWVKTVLISQLVNKETKICELACGTGIDIGKWIRASISTYIAIDNDENLLTEAKDRWEKKQTNNNAHFLKISLFDNNFIELNDFEKDCDSIAAFNGLAESFENEIKVKAFLENAARRLKKNGFFFGIVADSSSIWCKIQKDQKSLFPSIAKGEYYSIEFENKIESFFGVKYTLTIKDVQKKTEYLVHFPSLIRIAKLVGFEVLEISNFCEFYEENKWNYIDYLNALRVLDKENEINPNQIEIIGLFTTFIFRKL
eukprot:TRINITY_DN1211_c0_g2_i1.p1 TRINITY_DN1211_c0_g2~~TRINITY_DN1211_c0_g2_i1.p1  ORF type:complete len:294 (+),score=124.51 TRINITY_DN1211_c0_g2_i1:62-883(+)